MNCSFCHQPLVWASHTNSDLLTLRECRNCQFPKYNTLHRRLYDASNNMLADSFRIDEYYINLFYRRSLISSKCNYTMIFKNVIGIFENSPDMEPMSLSKPVCEIDSLLELPFYDLELLKKKLDTYTLFS